MINIIKENVNLLKDYIEDNYTSIDTRMKDINLECLDKVLKDFETFVSKNPNCEIFKKYLEERLLINDEINKDNELLMNKFISFFFLFKNFSI